MLYHPILLPMLLCKCIGSNKLYLSLSLVRDLFVVNISYCKILASALSPGGAASHNAT